MKFIACEESTMKADVLVPVIIPDEARATIDELGLRRQVGEMIEHTQQAVTGLHSIEIEVWYERDVEDHPPIPHVTIIGWREGHRSKGDEVTEREWFDWSVRTYPPEVKQHISFVVQYRGDHGR
jgi:hypothetical protein